MDTNKPVQKMNLEFIMNWCVENKQVPWLKAKIKETRPITRYPRIKVNGKLVADKSAEPTVTQERINFFQIKNDFINEFMPEMRITNGKKPSMYDLIENLKE